MSVLALDAAARLRAISVEVCEEVFRPPPQLTVSTWADQNRILPRTSAEPGRWRTDRVPYLRRIMDVLGDEAVREVVFAKSAQVGGTSCGENFIGYLMDQAPCGILMLWPTEKKMRSWSRKQLEPLLADTPCLARLFPRSGRRDAGNTMTAKEFPGGFLQMLTAGSTSDLRSTSARVGIVEEVDEIDSEVGYQGDPLEQFEARFRTFWNSKIYFVSTPTIEGFSRVWEKLERSTNERFHVPCPHCGHMQVLRWRDGKDDQDEAGSYRLVWEKDEHGEVVPGSTRYICEACGALIEEYHKMGMLLAGDWIAKNPGRYAVGFHINTLYSPFTPWDDVARAFQRAVHSPTTMQGFVNLWLGLPYREPGADIDAHFLQQRAESYGEGVAVPHGVGVVVGGADVQGDRIELFLWGFGEGEESWFLSWEVFDGDPGDDAVWDELGARLDRGLVHASGAPVPILACCIDAGYQTEMVHRFCDRRRRRNTVAVVGRDGRPRKLIEAPGQTKFKRSRSKKRPTHVIGSDPGKDLFASRLRLSRREDGSCPPGYVHFPDTVDRAFYDQLTAERLVTRYVAKRPVRKWVPIQGRRNEALDCAVYAMGALELLVQRRVLRREDLGARAKALSEWKPPEKKPAEPAARTARPKVRRPGGWVQNW